MWEVRLGLANLVVGLVCQLKFSFVRYGGGSVEVFEKNEIWWYVGLGDKVQKWSDSVWELWLGRRGRLE